MSVYFRVTAPGCYPMVREYRSVAEADADNQVARRRGHEVVQVKDGDPHPPQSHPAQRLGRGA